MGGKTVTRADLGEAVYKTVGLSRTESAQLVEAVIEEICASVERGEAVKLSSFGSFLVRSKTERIGRNPKTGDSVELKGKNVPHFKPGKELRERVNIGLQSER